MEQRTLGPSGPRLSLVGLGTNNFGGRIDLEASRKVVHKALDVGVTHFDTADIYGGSGGSETIIGKTLGKRRDEVTLATKFGKPMAGLHEQHRGSRAYVALAVDASLKRLQTDRIDLLWMHEPDPSTAIEETFRALEDLRKAGKVGHVGSSNFSAAELEDAAKVAKKIGVAGFVGAQDEYSLNHIVCPHCAAVNRVPEGKPAADAKCGVCHKVLFTGHPLQTTRESFDKHIGRNDIPVVVDFWAAWCGPCQAMAPVYERVAAEVEPAMRFLKVDTDRETELAARYAIRSIPTLMVFRNGKPVAHRAGAVDAATLRTWLRQQVAAAAA